MVRRVLKYLFVYLLYATGALWLARKRVAQRNGIAVLMFHRVLPDEEFQHTSSLPGIIVRQRTFAALAAYVRNHCTPTDLLCKPFEENGSAGPRVGLTFDDGWADNKAIAAPILKLQGLPAIVFICPALMGRRFPFWPERVVAAQRQMNTVTQQQTEQVVESLKDLGPIARERVLSVLQSRDEPDARDSEPLNATLTWEDVTVLRDDGLAFGSHTQSHQILTQLGGSAVIAEVRGSKDAVESRLKVPSDTFSYPNGNHSAAIRSEVRRAGYRLAFTTRLGLWTASCDPLCIPRINMTEQHVTGPTGQFSRAMFEYHAFWRPSVCNVSAVATNASADSEAGAHDRDALH